MRIAIAIWILLVAGSVSAQHIPLQSQYMFNAVALNPAFTGSEEAFSVVGSYRAQWVGIDGAPTTQSITAHAPLKNTKSAIGLQVYADQIGVDNNTGIFASYAYRMQFTNARLSLGLSGGVNFLRSYSSRLQVNDDNDELLVSDSPLGVLPDFSFGAHYNTNKYFVAFSVPMFMTHSYVANAFETTNDFANYNMILGGGASFRLNDGTVLKPSTLIKYHADAKIQFDINVMAQFNDVISAGISYRTQEAIIGLVEYSATKQLGIMYSFGMPLNSLSQFTYGSHEISLKYSFLYKSTMIGPRFMEW